MKIRAILFAFLLVLTPMTKAHANAGQCASSTAEFFGIAIYNYWGTFDPISTAIARRAFLNGCTSGVVGQIDSIIAVFWEVP